MVLTGNVFNTLKNIDAIGNDLDMNQGGGCGKAGQMPDRAIYSIVRSADMRAEKRSTAPHHPIGLIVTLYLDRQVKYDNTTHQFIDDEQANRMRSEALREPWRV